jgi:hypothetical protein
MDPKITAKTIDRNAAPSPHYEKGGIGKKPTRFADCLLMILLTNMSQNPASCLVISLFDQAWRATPRAKGQKQNTSERKTNIEKLLKSGSGSARLGFGMVRGVA